MTSVSSTSTTPTNWEFNAGGGSRWYSADRDRIFGVNAYYDGRKTATTFFNQIGVGVESLGKYVDFRANGYAVVGPNSSVIGYNNPTFRGSNIVLDTLIENALSGFDFEIGTPIPFLERWDTRAFVGHYHYAAEQGLDVSGVRVRLEANVNHNMSLYFAAQHDAVLRTTVSGGIALNFGGRKVCREQRGTADRLDARVVRDVNIVSYNPDPEEATRVTATDPTTGQPIVVRHANSAAAAGGDGTVEKPFNTLADLQNGSAPTNILLLHANSTFVNPALKLKNCQRLLGEGINHTFTSTTGTFNLPRATTGTTPPLLNLFTGGFAVTLAQDNEVSGLSYQSPNGFNGFILGSANLGTFDINRNITTGLFSSQSIHIGNATGNGVIRDNTIGGGGTGINVVGNHNQLRLLIENNQITAVSIGVNVVPNGGTSFVSIRDNKFTSAVSAQDFQFSGTHTLQLRNNSGTGAFPLTQRGGVFNLEIDIGTNPAPFITPGTILNTTPIPSTVSGTINLVPAGSAGFP